jgi:PIN domain nuclease of toxin-antitoxin system
MKILLDTHVLLWVHTKPSRLGKKTRHALASEGGVFFSPISVFEWFQKDGLDGLSAKDLVAATKSVGFQELPLGLDAILDAPRFGSLRDRDPMDLLLLSQAAAGRMHFYTADRFLLELGLDFVKDAEA